MCGGSGSGVRAGVCMGLVAVGVEDIMGVAGTVAATLRPENGKREEEDVWGVCGRGGGSSGGSDVGEGSLRIENEADRKERERMGRLGVDGA